MHRNLSFVTLLVGTICHGALLGAEPPRPWEKHTINDRSPFEGAGAADFNGDGRIDVFSGDSWYEAPDWKRHRVRSLPASPNPHYHEDFADLPLDVNQDGKMDIVTCAYFTKRLAWVEQPDDPTKPWKEHTIDRPGPMETARLVDLNGDGRPDLLPNVGGEVVWYENTGTTPGRPWRKRSLGLEGSGHGIGMGDLNGDDQMDVITPHGWYEQTRDSETRWRFHDEFELGAASILIIGRDFDEDGDTDIVWGMGHDFGLFWLEQQTDSQGRRVWIKGRVDTSFSQVHTLQLADLDGDNRPEVITGKRVYAHEREPGATDAPCIYYYQFNMAKSQWIRGTIYEGSPAGNAPANAQDRRAMDDFERGKSGEQVIEDGVGVDATGQVFNSIVAVEQHQGHQQNPFVNAGAIATTGLIRGAPRPDKWQKILGIHRSFAGRELQINQPVYKSEAATNQRNKAIAQLMAAYGHIQDDPDAVTDVYTEQCSINVCAKDLAVMAATLANGGKNPVTGKKVIDEEHVPKILAVMATAGLYDDSGVWLYNVGLPAKSGVGGGIVAVSPGRFGIAAFSPPLDAAGNSVRAQRAIEYVSNQLDGNPYAVRPHTPRP